MAKLIILDTETTGLSADKHGIWQIGGVIEIDGVKKESFLLEMNPGNVEYVQSALDGCNITEKEIKQMESSEVIFSEEFIPMLDDYVNKFDANDKFQFVAYNAKFDMDMVRAWFIKHGHKYFGSYFYQNPIDLFGVVGIVLIPHRHKIPNMKLATVCELFEIDLVNAHDAEDDSEATYKLFKMLQRDHIKE